MRKFSMKADSRGSIAVEAAFIFPVFLMLVLATVEIGFILFAKTLIQSAARSAVRAISIEQVAVANSPAFVSAQMPGWMSPHTDTKVAVQTVPGSVNKLYTVTVRISTDHASPIRNFFSGRQLESVAVMYAEQPG
jgi:Flp pilus assembly protein TadG